MPTDEPDPNAPPAPEAPQAPGAPPAEPPGALPAEPPGAPPPSRHHLTRSNVDRVIAGVAGGFAEYLDVDPVLVRIAFVVLLVVTGGLFGAFYLLAMIIMPEGEGTVGASAPVRAHRRRESSATAGVVVGVLLIVVGAIALARTVDVPAPPWEAIFAGLLVLTGLGIIVDARHGVHGGLVALALLFAGLAAVTSATPHIGMQSGFGDRTERPQTLADLQGDYSHAFGSLVVDLRDVPLAEGTTHVNVSMAFGDVTVMLPPGVPARVTGQTVFGSSQILGRSFDGVSVDHQVTGSGYAQAQRRLEIDLSNVFGSAAVR